MSEVCAFTIVMPIWFLWTISVMFFLWAVLEAIRLVLDYRLRRLKTEIGDGS